jgi:hypothetical protein
MTSQSNQHSRKEKIEMKYDNYEFSSHLSLRYELDGIDYDIPDSEFERVA